MPNADWMLTEEKINVALGGEIRRARVAAGLSRPKLVELLPFEITVASLVNWELGKRGIAFMYLVEVARTLNYSATQLLQRAIARAETIQTQYVDIDLDGLREDSTARWVMLRTWAEKRNELLLEGDSRIVRLHHTVVREWAVLLGVHLVDLVIYLRKVADLTPVVLPLPED